jgi:hypothetical protein
VNAGSFDANGGTLAVLNLARVREAVLRAIGDPRTYGITAWLRF